VKNEHVQEDLDCDGVRRRARGFKNQNYKWSAKFT
jgi:hypothetical protein